MSVGSGVNLQEAEYSWFALHISGFGVNSPLEDLKRAYFVSIVGEQSNKETVMELERRWLRSLSGVTSTHYGDMWREAVVGAGQVPQNDISQNKLIYYKTVV